MNKSDLNSSMLYKMKNGKLYALLENHYEETIEFYDKECIEEGFSGDGIYLNDYDENLSPENDDYDIVAIKQCNGAVSVIHRILNNEEPKYWDWVEEVEETEPETQNTVQNITINITVDPHFNIDDFVQQLSSKLRNIPRTNF